MGMGKQTTNIPLNQSATDDVNGIIPLGSHSPVEGSISHLTDATSPTDPTSNVILGPDNTWVGVTWDFGDLPEGEFWRLDRVDIWIAGEDNLRKGFRGDFSTSLSGNIDDFTVVPNSEHEAELTQNANFNLVRYDFPGVFIAGDEPDQDQYPVEGFRYLRFNSRGYNLEDVDWQSRFVEIDIWVSQIPEPGTYALGAGLIAIAGVFLRRRFRH